MELNDFADKTDEEFKKSGGFSEDLDKKFKNQEIPNTVEDDQVYSTDEDTLELKNS